MNDSTLRRRRNWLQHIEHMIGREMDAVASRPAAATRPRLISLGTVTGRGSHERAVTLIVTIALEAYP
jgi:hypothetical protein